MLLVGLAAAACARVRPLEGGPADVEPPRLLGVEPADSTTNLSRLPRFEIEWSERLAPNTARGGLRIIPYVRFAEVELHGTRMTVTLSESLPPDTTVVLVLSKRIQDRAGRDNALPAEIALVYSTGPELRGAAVLGKLRVKGTAEPRAVIAWVPAVPDTVTKGPRRPTPVAAADAEGLFRLVGIPPGVPFLLRGFLDRNGNLLADEDELSNLYPDTLRLGVREVRRGLDWNLMDPDEPGQIRGVALNQGRVSGPLAVAVRAPKPRSGGLDADLGKSPAPTDSAAADTAVARADTLRPLPLAVAPRDSSAWSAAYAALEPRGFVRREWLVVYVSPRGDYSVRVPPGRHALVAFVDVRRDTAPGLYVPPDSTRLEWEPLSLPDTLQVDPGGTVRARTIEIRER